MSYQKAIDLLTATKEQVSAILSAPDQEHHRLTVESTIDRLVRNLGFSTKSDIGELAKPAAPGPATTMAGKPIPTRNDVKRSDLEPAQEKIRVLREKVEGTYETFLTTESLDLLRNYDENIIRGVAKKAKMRVTKDDPEEITLKFIEEIKENIRLQAQKAQDMEKLKEESVETGGEEVDEIFEGQDPINIVDNDAVIEEETNKRGRRGKN